MSTDQWKNNYVGKIKNSTPDDNENTKVLKIIQFFK